MNVIIAETAAAARTLRDRLNLEIDDWAIISAETEYAIRGLTITNVILATELSEEQTRDLRIAWQNRGFILKYSDRDDFLADTYEPEFKTIEMVARMSDESVEAVAEAVRKYDEAKARTEKFGAPGVVQIPVELFEKIEYIQFKTDS